jgi:hypothetical protein
MSHTSVFSHTIVQGDTCDGQVGRRMRFYGYKQGEVGKFLVICNKQMDSSYFFLLVDTRRTISSTPEPGSTGT